MTNREAVNLLVQWLASLVLLYTFAVMFPIGVAMLLWIVMLFAAGFYDLAWKMRDANKKAEN